MRTATFVSALAIGASLAAAQTIETPCFFHFPEAAGIGSPEFVGPGAAPIAAARARSSTRPCGSTTATCPAGPRSPRARKVKDPFVEGLEDVTYLSVATGAAPRDFAMIIYTSEHHVLVDDNQSEATGESSGASSLEPADALGPQSLGRPLTR